MKQFFQRIVACLSRFLQRMGVEIKKSRDGDANRNMLRLTYGVLLVFGGLILYEGYFLAVKREDVINNDYNKRLGLFEERVERGKILSFDGQILAESHGDGKRGGEESRSYPYGSLFAHPVGYCDHGTTGVEKLGNYYLLTSHIDPFRRAVLEGTGRKEPGDQVVTTLDTGLQTAAAEALAGRKGAVLALEPETGNILAMVSSPGFDPNRLSEDWERLISSDNQEGQLLNRASQGLYPPGSVFKIVMLLEYIRENPADYDAFRFDCDGLFEYEADGKEYAIRCYHGNAHGSQDLNQAFANSCNGAFAYMGLSMDQKRLMETAEQLLFGKELPFPLEYQKSSYVLEDGQDAWQVLQTSIGQGKTLVTPLHMALMTSAIANDGILMKPRLFDRVETEEGRLVRSFGPSAYGSLMLSDEAAVLRDKMALVVTDGTASALRGAEYTAAGKTGSAEFETGKETHAWFTGYAPAEDPKLVVTVLVEEGGSGGKAAAPIARNIFDAYFAR